MIYIAILIGCIVGAILGSLAPVIPYTYSSYLSIAIIAALDTVFGGISSVVKGNFDLKILSDILHGLYQSQPAILHQSLATHKYSDPDHLQSSNFDISQKEFLSISFLLMNCPEIHLP